MSIEKIIKNWDKNKLSNFLDKLYDTEHTTSWTKSKLQGQLLKHSAEDVLGICTVPELKTGLSLLGLSTTGKKKDLYERLVDGCNSNTDQRKKSKTTSSKSAKTKAKKKTKSTSKTTKKKTDESSLGGKLIRLLEGDASSFQQGLALFEALDWEDQEPILKNYPISKKSRVTHWANNCDQVKERGSEILDKDIDNHFLNIGFVLHALADAPQITTVKSTVLWLNNPMNSDFISLLIKCTSLTKLEFRIPLENNKYDSIKANSLVTELQSISKKMELTSRYFRLIEGGYLFDVVEELILQGETSEKPYPFPEVLTKSVKKDNAFIWGNWYHNDRANVSINTQFSSIKSLLIVNDPILYSIYTETDLESLELNDLSNLRELGVSEPVKKLKLQDVEQLFEMDINTSKMTQYILTHPLQNGLSPSVNKSGKSAIVKLFKEQKKNTITVVEDHTYGFGFIDKWKHLTHDEVWTEMVKFAFSVEHILKYIKASIQNHFGEDSTEEVTIESGSEVIWSMDFEIEDFPNSYGYDMQLHTWAEWKGRWSNVDPQIESDLSKHDHSDSEHYEQLIEIVVDSDGICWDEYIWSEIVSFIPKSKYKELEKLIAQNV